MHLDLIVHGVEPELLSVVDEDAARFVVFDRQQRIVPVFRPMDKVFRDGHVSTPQSRLFVATAVEIGIVISVVFHDLIQGDLPIVILVWTELHHGFVVDISPHLRVFRRCQPDA